MKSERSIYWAKQHQHILNGNYRLLDNLRNERNKLETKMEAMTDLADELVYLLRGHMEQVYGVPLPVEVYKRWRSIYVKFCEIKQGINS